MAVVLGGEHCGIQKKILHAGRGKPSDFPENTKVLFHYQTRLCDDEHTVIDNTKAHGHKPMELLIGRKFKFDVWENCVKTMCVGEVASFTCKASLCGMYPLVAKSLRDIAHDKTGEHQHHCCGMTLQEHGLGYKDLDELMKNPADLEFILELLKVEEPGEYRREAWTLDNDEKMAAVPVLKEEGNALYKEKKYEAAADKYAEAIGILETLALREKPGEEEHTKIENQKIPFLLNYSQCKLFIKDYYPVIEHTTEVLKKDPDNVKALFRRAKAHVGAWNPEDARQDFIRVRELDQSLSKTVTREIAAIDELIKRKDADDRAKLQGKMFG